jgi:PEP-CTERM motif
MKTVSMVKSLSVLVISTLCSPAAHATSVSVQNLGSILNDSISFPDTKTPGAGKAFQDYFEFTLPTAEYITASMSISGPLSDQIPTGKGTLSLYTFTSTSSFAPFIPMGTLIEEATLSAPSLGGQTAVVGSFSPFGDFEQAGTYFVEVAGTSGLGSLKLAVDGNVTAVAGGVPEPSTWAMFGIGFAGLAGMGLHRRRGNRESARYAV